MRWIVGLVAAIALVHACTPYTSEISPASEESDAAVDAPSAPAPPRAECVGVDLHCGGVDCAPPRRCCAGANLTVCVAAGEECPTGVAQACCTSDDCGGQGCVQPNGRLTGFDAGSDGSLPPFDAGPDVGPDVVVQPSDAAIDANADSSVDSGGDADADPPAVVARDAGLGVCLRP